MVRPPHPARQFFSERSGVAKSARTKYGPVTCKGCHERVPQDRSRVLLVHLKQCVVYGRNARLRRDIMHAVGADSTDDDDDDNVNGLIVSNTSCGNNTSSGSNIAFPNVQQPLLSFRRVLAVTDQAAADRALSRAFVSASLAYDIIENAEVRAFLRRLEPAYTPSSADTLRRELLPAGHAKSQVDIIDAIRDLDRVTLAMDGWTDVAGRSVLAIVALVPERPALVLALDSTPSHTTLDIVHAVNKATESFIENWGKVNAVVSDNAPNMAAARRQLAAEHPGVLNLGDTPHVLALVSRAYCNYPFMQSVLKVNMRLAAHLKKSETSSATLYDEAAATIRGTVTRIRPFSETRWSDAAHLCAAVRDLESPLRTVKETFSNESLAASLNSVHFAANRDLAAMLGPVLVAIDRLQGCGATLPDILYSLLRLARTLSGTEVEDHTFKTFCGKIFEQRFQQINCEILALAMALDPRRRLLALSGPFEGDTLLRCALGLAKEWRFSQDK